MKDQSVKKKNKYWREREEAQKKKNITDEIEYSKHINGIYLRSLRDAQTEINAFYARYAAKEGISMAAAKKRVSRLDIEAYAQKAKKYVAEKNFSKQANEEMRIYNLTMKVNRLELLKAEIGLHLVEGFNEIEEYLGDKLNARAMDEFKRQAGILGHTVTNPAELAHSIVNASFQNAKFSDRVWLHQDALKHDLHKLLSNGLIQGLHPQTLADSIKKTFAISTYNATRLMRTELARVQTDAQLKSYKMGGFDSYEFITIGEKACPECKPLDGQIFKISEARVGENLPPMHPNCRCSTAASTDEEAYNAWLDSGAAKNGVSFKDFSDLYTRGKGEVLFEKSFDPRLKENKQEVEQAYWLVDTFGGKIRLLVRSLSRPTPDYEWNEMLWELKTPQSVNGSDKLVHRGLKQIEERPGGILVDCGGIGDSPGVIEVAKARLKRSGKDKKIRIIVKDGQEVVAILK